GREVAKKFYCFDLQQLADEAGSVISASLFGAIAGSAALPFPREAFEATIRRGGVGVDASLKAFSLGFDAAANAPESPLNIDTSRPVEPVPETAAHPRVRALLDTLKTTFPASTQPML